jgi:hypothetical protein
MFKRRAMLLAGVSALAILACAGGAKADPPFTTPGMFSFVAPATGEYSLEAFGASGGDTPSEGTSGGLGAEVSGDLFLTAGQDLTLFVGGHGQNGVSDGTGGGGGGSFVFFGTNVLAVAGGGGGAGMLEDGRSGQSGTSGQNGALYGGAGGTSGNGGGGGTYYSRGIGFNGGGGAGVNSGAAGFGGDGAGPASGFGGQFPNGGAGYSGGAGSGGGYGGGGGGGSVGGGGGGGFSGGGGGGGAHFGYGGGGGGSYLASLFTGQVLTGGVNSGGDGSISITAVPEPSTWAMTLAGFARLGWLARMRGRKLASG